MHIYSYICIYIYIYDLFDYMIILYIMLYIPYTYIHLEVGMQKMYKSL